MICDVRDSARADSQAAAPIKRSKNTNGVYREVSHITWTGNTACFIIAVPAMHTTYDVTYNKSNFHSCYMFRPRRAIIRVKK